MKNGIKVLIGIVVVLVLGAIVIGGSYNSLVTNKEEVDSKLSNIDVQLERRASLIPNLVSTVKGYTKHEESVIEKITTARQNLVSATNVKEKAKANDELTSALSNLNVIVENYPDLKANTVFINLQDELAGTENRITVARTDYNDAVKSYNTTIKKFPKSIIASMFGFKEAEYFETSSKNAETPTVSFD